MSREFRKACLAICGVVIFGFTASAGLPRFVEAIDRCELLWSNKKYEALFEYINELEHAAPDYVPTRILAALRDEHFGEQYEDASSTMRAITNLAYRAICEVAPEFLSRLGQLADSADSAVSIFNRIGQNKGFRKVNNDPRKRVGYTNRAPFLASAFKDIPFLVPNICLPSTSSNSFDLSTKKTPVKPLEKEKLARKVFFEKGITFQEKQDLLDDYLTAKVDKTGVKGLIKSFDDDFILLNGYSVVEVLKKEDKLAVQSLREHLNHVDSEKFSDSSLRMAAWVFLQFATDKTEVADYLKELRTRVIDRNSATKDFLSRAIQHLEGRCMR